MVSRSRPEGSWARMLGEKKDVMKGGFGGELFWGLWGDMVGFEGLVGGG